MGGITYNLSNEEKEINEWTCRSRKEGVCGKVSCLDKPTTQCKKCTNYYCLEHFPSHLDLVPDSDDFEYDTTSSNEGLDVYMD